MADYIYLLETRITAAQRSALRAIREIAKAKGLTVFLVGGAIRDLTSGSPVRDLDLVVQGNALKLRKDLEKAGAVIQGESEASQALFTRFPGGVRLELGSTLSVTYPKPGKPVMRPANILDDLRRRDFTANAMALSLNDGSYGLLMDPLNGVADIEVRQLRLASNYGFIEDPVRMIRASRLMARLGWTLEERTQTRYDTGKQEGYISALSDFARGYETEEIVYEEDPLRVLKALEAEGWMQSLAPFWTTGKANAAELDRLRDVQGQLETHGIHADAAAAGFPLLTAKLAAKEVAQLKASFARPGFVTEIEGLEAAAKQFGTQLAGKAALPSEAWRLITSSSPEAVLWTAFTSKSPTLQAKIKSFYTEWPQARQRIPYTLMQEMRISPELPGYDELLEKLFFELMDGRLSILDEMKAFLEPYSPPPPPPPVNLRRRAAKKESKGKGRGKKAAARDESEDEDLAAGDAEPSEPLEASPEAATAEVAADADVPSEPEVEAAPAPAPAASPGPAIAPVVTSKEMPAQGAVAPKSVPVDRPAPVKRSSKAPEKASPAAVKPTPAVSAAALTKETAPAKKVAGGKPAAKTAATVTPAKKSAVPPAGAKSAPPDKPRTPAKSLPVAPAKGASKKTTPGPAQKASPGKPPTAAKVSIKPVAPARKQVSVPSAAKKTSAKPSRKR